MKEITIDCSAMHHISQFHGAIAQTLHFPETYGRNLDALHDLLTSLTAPTHLELKNLSQAGFPILALQRVLRDCEEENPRFTVSW